MHYMRHIVIMIVFLLLASRTCAIAETNELTNIRKPSNKLTIYSSVDCSSIVRSDVSLKKIGGVDVDRLPHLDAYRLTPRRPGVFAVGDVKLYVAKPLPKSDVGFGFYYSPGRLKYPLEKMYFEDMKKRGMNTLTVQANGLPGLPPDTNAASATARQINTGVEVGLIDRRFPIICYSVNAPDVVDAWKYKKPNLKWPELVVQSIDEPNHTQMKYLEEYYNAAHALGIRIGTACAGYGITGYNQELPWCAKEDEGKPVPGYGQFLDIWVVLTGTSRDTVYSMSKERNTEIWSYCAYPINNASMHRWTFGLYAWKCQAKVNLIWAYIDEQTGFDYSRAIETPDGPLTTFAMEGLSEGITDYRVLQAVSKLGTKESKAFLKQAEDAVTMGWWPRGYVKDNQHLEKPTVDMAAIRRRGLMLLGG